MRAVERFEITKLHDGTPVDPPLVVSVDTTNRYDLRDDQNCTSPFVYRILKGSLPEKFRSCRMPCVCSHMGKLLLPLMLLLGFTVAPAQVAGPSCNDKYSYTMDLVEQAEAAYQARLDKGNAGYAENPITVIHDVLRRKLARSAYGMDCDATDLAQLQFINQKLLSSGLAVTPEQAKLDAAAAQEAAWQRALANFNKALDKLGKIK